MTEQVRRAKLQDLDSIVALTRDALPARSQLDEAEVTEWLYNKGVWVALSDDALVGVAAWQAENLLAVTDVLHVAPPEHWLDAGGQLLATIEQEAHTLMCEANVVLLPAQAAEAARTLLQERGYEEKTLDELHRIWREVLNDFVSDELGIMVKRLRERMVMVPI